MDDNIGNLFDFVKSDDHLEELSELLDSGIDPNYQTVHGTSPLHVAAGSQENNIKVVQELIRRGAEVDLRNHLNYTPLHNAVLTHKLDVVNELLMSGASANAKCYLGQTPLHLAIISLESGEDIHADLRIICSLLQQEGIDCNVKDAWGYTPLMEAIKNSQETAALLMLDKNANPHVCNEFSESTLHMAFSLSESSIEFDLLLRGVSIYSRDKWGLTPLDVLIIYGLGSRDNTWIKLIYKVIAFKYSVTSDLKQKLELIPHLSQFFNECCDEVDYMRRDYISGNLTVHDIVWSCFHENDSKCVLFQIHKPVVDRLVRGTYPLYCWDILDAIPEFSLLTILQMTACCKNRAKRKVKDLAELFTIFDVVSLFSEYLSYVDIFCLIVAFSDATISESMQNLQPPDLLSVFEMESCWKIDNYFNQ